MKKVRYAIGIAAGVAPVLGLMAPAAQCRHLRATQERQDGVPAAQRDDARHDQVHGYCQQERARPAQPQLPQRGHRSRWPLRLYAHGSIYFSTSPQPVHSMRTQVFSAHGHTVFSGRVHSIFSSGRVSFTECVGVKGHKVCETVFKASHPNHAVAGPVCETI